MPGNTRKPTIPDPCILLAEAGAVVPLRLQRIAQGGAEAWHEAQLMVSEKWVAHGHFAGKLLSGRVSLSPLGFTRDLVAHYLPEVRANRQRLERLTRKRG
jgi:hypothetical protein